MDISIDSTAVVARFEAFPLKLVERLGVHVERFLLILQSFVVSQKLSGDPLNRRSGQLSASVNTNGPNTTATQISGTVGTNLPYGRVHELGGTFDIREHLRQVTQVFGRRLETPVMAMVRAHAATYPNRSFLRSSLRENSDTWIDEMNAAVSEAVGNGAA